MFVNGHDQAGIIAHLIRIELSRICMIGRIKRCFRGWDGR